MMSFFVRVINRPAVCLMRVWPAVFIFAAAFNAFSQTNYYATNGIEYPIIGQLPGDQVFPDVALTPAGGYVVWQDNITDGSGWGISAMQLNSTLSGSGSTFRVNVIGTNDQENARVSLLKTGGAAFVWQGGVEGLNQHIYARFLSPSNTWLSSTDVLVNTFTNNFQINPAMATLADGNVVVVWSSYNEASSNSQLDVYGQLLSPGGAKVGGEFLINQSTAFNQRTPTVAALTNGGFVVAWVSEQERVLAPALDNNTNSSYYTGASALVTASVDIYARLFTSNAVASTGEFLVDAASNPCADPAVAVATDGSYIITWCARDMVTTANGYDILGRTFTNGTPSSAVFYINSTLYGDQYAPRVSVIGQDYLVTWTSLGQDGSREGVYAQFIHDNATRIGGEFRVNTTTIGQQMQPAVTSDGLDQFLVVWTSFTGLPYNFDLYAQRFINASGILVAMPAPFVWAPFVVSNNVYQPQLAVTWAPLVGLVVSNYEVYVNGGSSPMGVVTSNEWIMTAANGLTTSSTNSFAVDYVLNDGRRSPISASTSGSTWGGGNWGGIPFEWMEMYYGLNAYTWPSPTANLPGGVTLYQVFLSGGNPLDPTTWLHSSLNQTAEGIFLTWNTQAGATYQVIATGNFLTWTNVGAPRFASGTTDSIYIGGNAAGYYRVVLLR